MTNFIPLFPLSIVVYPGEALNLHIFEPRYKQLITDCFANKKPFGIPAVINNKVMDFGTLVTINEISTTYDNGEMDIKTTGVDVFNILESITSLPNKLYHGAIVTYPIIKYNGSDVIMKKIITAIRALHQLLNVNKNFAKQDDDLCSYDVAHHAGMSLHDEYRLLELTNEIHRQEFLHTHLIKTIETMAQMNLLVSKIKLNGHFKNLEGFDFSKQ